MLDSPMVERILNGQTGPFSRKMQLAWGTAANLKPRAPILHRVRGVGQHNSRHAPSSNPLLLFPIFTYFRVDSNGAPGQVLYTLENPSNIVSISSTPSDFTFSAPAQARLTAGRTYWIVIHSTGRAMDLRITESDAEDDGCKQ